MVTSMEWPESTTDDVPAHPPASAFMPALQAPWSDRGDAVGDPVRTIDFVDEGAFHPPKPPEEWNELEAAYALAYRIVYCLIGAPHASSMIASEAVRVAADPDRTASGDLSATVAGAAIELVLAHHVSLVEHGVMDPSQVSKLLHRTRLIRELRRWDAPSRTVLALRHLDHRTPAQVARDVDLAESAVRAVTSHWLPSDARAESAAMLAGIDAWIGGSLKTTDEATIGPLAVLDDPVATVPHIERLEDLPGTALPSTEVESAHDLERSGGGRLRHRASH